MQKFITSTAIISLSFTGAVIPALAGEMEDKIIAQLTQAYGGAKFENLTTIVIENDLRDTWIGQGHTADFVNLNPLQRNQIFDLKNQKASAEVWGGAGNFNNRVIWDGAAQTNINYIEGTYQTPETGGYYETFGGSIRSIDPLLAYDVVTHPEALTYKGTQYYQNGEHHLAEFDMQGTAIDPLIWVHSETGLITRMERQLPDFTLRYIFDNHKAQNGITYAPDFSLYADDLLVQYTKSRTIRPGRIKASVFSIDKGVSAAPDGPDSSEMNVDKVSETVHHTGQGGSFSAFVDAGDHVIAIGLYGGLKDRYDAYVAAKGAKPLKYVIATHHHEDHLGGTVEALALGAKIIAPASARPHLELKTGGPIPDAQLELMTSDRHSAGPVDLYMIGTPHAKDYILAYIPGAKTIFEEDHYFGAFKDRASTVNANGAALWSAANKLGLDVEYLLSGHSRKIESWSGFSQMAAKYTPDMCPTGRKICRNKS